jgi:ubiquinone/menaquinone biosynthesis C-methylase UbiE
VVGVDITDVWFDDALRRAAEGGVELDLRVGDAEDLPVEDQTFDAVLSNFGATLAPRHPVVAAELARACRRGVPWRSPPGPIAVPTRESSPYFSTTCRPRPAS